MSIENLLTELVAAIRENTAAQQGQAKPAAAQATAAAPATAQEPAGDKPRRGRPSKAAQEAAAKAKQDDDFGDEDEPTQANPDDDFGDEDEPTPAKSSLYTIEQAKEAMKLYRAAMIEKGFDKDSAEFKKDFSQLFAHTKPGGTKGKLDDLDPDSADTIVETVMACAAARGTGWSKAMNKRLGAAGIDVSHLVK